MTKREQLMQPENFNNGPVWLNPPKNAFKIWEDESRGSSNLAAYLNGSWDAIEGLSIDLTKKWG
jgi:hypothetical protein